MKDERFPGCYVNNNALPHFSDVFVMQKANSLTCMYDMLSMLSCPGITDDG